MSQIKADRTTWSSSGKDIHLVTPDGLKKQEILTLSILHTHSTISTKIIAKTGYPMKMAQKMGQYLAGSKNNISVFEDYAFIMLINDDIDTFHNDQDRSFQYAKLAEFEIR